MSLCPSITTAFLCNARAFFHNFSSLCGVGLDCGGVGLAAACARAFPTPAALPAVNVNVNADDAAQTTTTQNRLTPRVLFITRPYFFPQSFPTESAADYKPSIPLCHQSRNLASNACVISACGDSICSKISSAASI